ncbi:hypothetical protein [Deinococcus sp. QL22]|uniref:hypothetical protein n=1 Tax=Deinococcus sp. QL22 TaxID=2939437 RepID=UPI0020181CCA|nr:hypothetical protein [Deinococcus sp. QL22]UQN10767.1 hypothetical protein M1R55_31550 [Deinococcus sp. QL22]UQN10813.1 hypothetical protein M1R55_31300 [Deinococcus sp. QL22]
MEQLSAGQLPALLERHVSFHDSVLHRVELRFSREALGRHVSVELEVLDQMSPDGWGKVRFEFRGVHRLSLLEDQTTNVVLSHGIEWTVHTDRITADLSPVHAEEGPSTFLISAQEVWFGSAPDASDFPKR